MSEYQGIIFMLAVICMVLLVCLLAIHYVLCQIERNTRPEPGDIRSFVKRNLEAKK